MKSKSDMSVVPVRDEMWGEILKIQSEAYSELEPESLETLRSKFLVSPDLCFVYRDDGTQVGSSQTQNKLIESKDILSYLIAHQWHSETPPKLYQPLPNGSAGNWIFLHDLSVVKAAAGKGIGKKMVSHLLAQARAKFINKILLVSVQKSVGFWEGFGFKVVHNQQASLEYGEDAKIMSLIIQA